MATSISDDMMSVYYTYPSYAESFCSSCSEESTAHPSNNREAPIGRHSLTPFQKTVSPMRQPICHFHPLLRCTCQHLASAYVSEDMLPGKAQYPYWEALPGTSSELFTSNCLINRQAPNIDHSPSSGRQTPIIRHRSTPSIKNVSCTLSTHDMVSKIHHMHNPYYSPLNASCPELPGALPIVIGMPPTINSLWYNSPKSHTIIHFGRKPNSFTMDTEPPFSDIASNSTSRKLEFILRDIITTELSGNSWLSRS